MWNLRLTEQIETELHSQKSFSVQCNIAFFAFIEQKYHRWNRGTQVLVNSRPSVLLDSNITLRRVLHKIFNDERLIHVQADTTERETTKLFWLFNAEIFLIMTSSAR